MHHCENCGTHSDFNGETCMLCGLDCISNTSIQTGLFDLLEQEGDKFGVTSVRTFEDDGILSLNNGLVLTMSDHSEYQITINKSR